MNLDQNILTNVGGIRVSIFSHILHVMTVTRNDSDNSNVERKKQIEKIERVTRNDSDNSM